MMKHKTLLLYPFDVEEAMYILGEAAGLYGDNGGDPDGSAWLPALPLSNDLDDPDHNAVQEILDQKMGEIVLASYYEDNEVDDLAKLLDIQDVLALAKDTDDWDAFCNAVDDRTLWAHYGAYGAMAEVWVVCHNNAKNREDGDTE